MENQKGIYEWLLTWSVDLQVMAREQFLIELSNTKANEHGIFEQQEANSIKALLHILWTRQSCSLGLTSRRFHPVSFTRDKFIPKKKKKFLSSVLILLLRLPRLAAAGGRMLN